MLITVVVLSIVVFAVAIACLGIASAATGAMATARGAVAAMRDASLPDEQREIAVQRASIRLIVAFLSIVLRSAGAMALGFLPIWLFDEAGLISVEVSLRFMSRWEVITISSVLLGLAFIIWQRVRISR